MFEVEKKIGSIIVVLVVQLVCCNIVFAQNTVWGSVQDTMGRPLQNVTVRLVTDKDTLSQFTDKQGSYSFTKVNGNTLYLAFSLIGYKVGYHSLFVLTKHNSIPIPLQKLEPEPLLIKDVNIVKVIPFIIKEDTVQFNFDAYRFRANSYLEEALKSLPGFNVTRDGAVFYNGKPIKRAQVDGKDFFGGNLTTATKYLPADFIQKLHVIDSYNKVDEATGARTGEAEKIINIILRPDKKQLNFGQLTLGGGTNERYLGSFGLNRFNDGRQLSVQGSVNNTNTNIVYLGGLSEGKRERSLLDIGDYADPIDGLNRVTSLGVNFVDQIGKRFSLSTSYNFIHQNNVTDGFSQLTSSYVGNIIQRKENYVLRTDDFNHKIKFSLQGTFKNQDELKIDGNLSFMNQKSLNNKDTEISSAQLKNIGRFEDSTRFTNPIGDLSIFYNKHFKKKGRNFVGNLIFTSNSLERNENVSDRYVEKNTTTGQNGNSDYLQDQLIHQNNVTNSSKMSLTYIEPFWDYGRFEFTYDFDITGISTVRSVYNRLSQSPILIDSLAVDYNYYYQSHRGGINYLFEHQNKLKVNVGFAVEPLVLEGYLPIKNETYAYENVNLIPTAYFWYKLSKSLDWQIDYKGRNNQPNFNQIAPVEDNSNSRNVIIGNPELKAEFLHRFTTRIRKSIPSKAQFFETNFAYNFALNKIVSDKIATSNSTVQRTTFRNASGYYDLRWLYVFNTPFISEDFQLDLMGSTDYFNNPSYIDNKKRITQQLLLNQSLQLKYLWNDSFECGLLANYGFNSAKYDIPFKTNISVNTLMMGLNSKFYLTDHLSLGTEMSQRFNDGYKNSFMNINQTVINGFVEFTFLPNKIALLRLQGFDLLDQNKSMGIYSEYIGNDVYEARNNRLGRYFMLSLNVRLQKLNKK